MQSLNGKVVMISANKYFNLLKRDDKLSTLEYREVDKWEGYEYHEHGLRYDRDIEEDVLSKVIKPVKR